MPCVLTGQVKDDVYFKPPPKELLSGDYLIKSANAQYAAMSMWATTCLFIYASRDKPKDKADMLRHVAMLSSAGAVICHFTSIHFKKKAGLKLNQSEEIIVHVTPNGATVAFSF